MAEPAQQRVFGASAVSPEIAEAAGYMLQELDQLKLTVAKLGTLRIVVVPNPEWYSRLCQQWLLPRPNRRWRRPRTIIRRVDVRRTLLALSQGRRGVGEYFDRVLDAVDWWRRQTGALDHDSP